MTENNRKEKQWEAVACAARFCISMENASETEKEDFVRNMVSILPRLYLLFSEVEEDGEVSEISFLSTYVDEEMYENIKKGIARLLGEDDTYLETFVEDMKYSDAPVGASVSEGLADIYQDLFNFATNVKESEGELLEAAFDHCRENFMSYWSGTLCNVMRPLNQLRYHPEN